MIKIIEKDEQARRRRDGDLRYICANIFGMPLQEDNPATELKPAPGSRSVSLLRTLLSLALFVAADYFLFKSWSAVLVLVSVIFLHESGHFIAMKLFGYKGITMTFVPFLGAYVSGEATHYSRLKKIIMVLAGPVPGIIAGMVLLLLYHQNGAQFYYPAALAFLSLNTFNLLPVSPLDGGQFIETFFLNGNQVLQIAFLFASLALVLFGFYWFNWWPLLLIGLFIGLRIRSSLLTYKVRKALDKKNIAYDYSYDELTDNQYAQIRDELIDQSNFLRKKFSPGEPSYFENELIPYIEKILLPAYQFNLTALQKIACLTVYVLALLLPFIQWLYMKA